MSAMPRIGVIVSVILISCGGENVPCDTSVVGNICTIAGNGDNGHDRDADTRVIPALEAQLSLPQDTLTAADGTLYIVDWNNHRVRRVDDQGDLRWVAGRGELGGSLDSPANGDFNHPTNLIFDKSGDNLLIAAWHNSKIRKISIATGEIVDVSGDGGRGYFGDGGPALSSTLDLPSGIALDADGNLVVMDQANQVIRWIDGEGVIHRLGGLCLVSSGGECAEGQEPVPCPAGPHGTPSGKLTCGDPATTCFGTDAAECIPAYVGDGGPATEMRMGQQAGQDALPGGRIAFDPSGQLYFADSGNHLIRRIDREGIVHRVAGQVPVDGRPQHGYSGDGGSALEATLNLPIDLSFSDEGVLYFTDVLNHCVRSIDLDGTIRTVVGRCGEKGYAGDDGPAEEALLTRPYGLEWSQGRLHVTDTGNSVIRSVLLQE